MPDCECGESNRQEKIWAWNDRFWLAWKCNKCRATGVKSLDADDMVLEHDAAPVWHDMCVRLWESGK